MVLKVLALYCTNDKLNFSSNLDKRTEKTYYSCWFRTKASPTFTKLHIAWYKDKRKIIPANIKELLTIFSPLGNACHGSFQNASGGVYLCTDSYTNLEVKLLASLSEKFNIILSTPRSICRRDVALAGDGGGVSPISHGRGRVYIWKASMGLLRKTARRAFQPHFHDYMLYRIGL